MIRCHSATTRRLRIYPSTCPCTHALDCHLGGFVNGRSDNIRDTDYSLLKIVTNDAETESILQPVTNKQGYRQQHTSGHPSSWLLALWAELLLWCEGNEQEANKMRQSKQLSENTRWTRKDSTIVVLWRWSMAHLTISIYNVRCNEPQMHHLP